MKRESALPVTIRTISIGLLIGLMGCKEGNKSPTHEHTDGNAARSGVTTKIQSGGPRQSKTNSGSIRPENELLDDLNRFGKQHIPRNEQWERYLETIRDLAKINPQAALDHLGSLGENDPAAADAGYIEVFKIVSACNPRLIETWLMNDWSKLKSGNLKDCCIYDAVFQLGQNAPLIGLGIINKTSFPGNESGVRDGFFKAFAVSDPNGAFAAARKLDPSSRDPALSSIALAAALNSPEFALEVAGQISDQRLAANSRSEVFREWFSQSPDTATAVFNALGKSEQADLLGINPLLDGSLLSAIAIKQPDALLSLMASLEPSIRNRAVLESFVYHTVTDHTEATFRIIARLPDSDMKSTMIDNAYRQLCETNLTAAVEQLNNTDDSLQRNLALKNIGGKIGSMGMAQTLDASEHLPLDEKKVLFENAWRSLTISDYQGLLSYIKDGMDSLQLPADKRDEIISMAADTLAHRNENEAIAWLDSVAENDKPGVMKGLARTMAANDPVKLGKFLDSIPHDNAWAVGVGIMIRAIEAVDAKKAEPWKAALGEYNASNPTRLPTRAR